MDEFELINNEIIYKNQFNLGHIDLYNIVWGYLFYDGIKIIEIGKEFEEKLITFVNKIKGFTVSIGYKGIDPENIRYIENSKFLFENGKYIPFTDYNLDIIIRDVCKAMDKNDW